MVVIIPGYKMLIHRNSVSARLYHENRIVGSRRKGVMPFVVCNGYFDSVGDGNTRDSSFATVFPAVFIVVFKHIA
ncbi:hypothetical protein SDC9_112073 [bioreactor metagenome]|uniref:Uncharacterized protein n=1 Tax=bioreactor metagenome TaxID=1076179 RepID=A0A645BKW9_9ZZZZ